MNCIILIQLFSPISIGLNSCALGIITNPESKLDLKTVIQAQLTSHI